MKYPTVREAVNTFFAYNSGDDWEERFPDALAASPEFRAALIAELSEAMCDNEFEWLPLLNYTAIASNEEIATEAEAKDWLKRRVVEQYLSSNARRA